MNYILEAMKAADLLREEYRREYSRHRAFIANHAINPSRLITSSRGRDVVGVCVYWQVRDPYDVMDGIVPPVPDAEGRYAYLPLLYVQKDHRDGVVLKEMFHTILDRHEKIDRICFRRYQAPRRYKRFGKRHADRIHVLRGLRNAGSIWKPSAERGVGAERAVAAINESVRSEQHQSD